MAAIKVCGIGEHQTVSYAARELAEYLQKMTGETVAVASPKGYDPSDETALWIGTGGSFPDLEMPEVTDPELDDAVCIRVKNGKGIIAGVNPRSVLLGVYRYLTELGCRWVRPGDDGEFIPKLRLENTSAEVSEAASYRHRGICIEGAVSYRHLRDIIEWAPRVGFNGYFIQFREGYTFFDRWYSHVGNPYKGPEVFSVEKARDLVRKAAGEIKKRSLLYHAVGHGWTCEPLGISGLGWDYPPPDELPPETAQYLALVNGKRQLWHGVPLNTNLCYSNPEVRRLIAEEIAGYAQEHPEIDILHFWLADGSNNQCECEECRTARPSDFYVKMLNEVDHLLTERDLDTRIVFLIYVDLLWPPAVERISNPDRFILMFAPITRTYSKAFAPGSTLPEPPPYERNDLTFPRGVDENVAFLRRWQDVFAGDSFDFDYHYMWDHYNDPGYTQMAKVLYDDIRCLQGIGLNGFVSCQTQRAFFPTGLGMMVMGWTLWNKELDFEDMARDYFAAAFGPDGQRCYEYLRNISSCFDPVYLRGEKPQVSTDAVRSLARTQKVISGFRPVIEKNVAAGDKCRAASWEYLKHHADICEQLAAALEARAAGDDDTASRMWEKVRETVWGREQVHPVLDVWLFTSTMGRKFSKK